MDEDFSQGPPTPQSLDAGLKKLESTVKGLMAKSISLTDEMKEKWSASDALVKQVTGDVYKELAFVKTQMLLVKLDDATAHDMKKRLSTIKDNMQAVKMSHAPKTGSLFVRLMLGRVNVRLYREGEKFIRKTEYEKFRSRTNVVFLLFVLARLAVWWTMPYNAFVDILETVWLGWLLYYYTTLALRENILKVNGSNIKLWWILHHYLSMIVSLAMLTWPKGDPLFLISFRRNSLFLSLMQAVTQFLITLYQNGRLYRAVAMGQASRYDVTGEAQASSFSEPSKYTVSAVMLLPFLLCTQFSQLVVGYLLYRDFQQFQPGWHPILVCAMCFILGTGNLLTTAETYAQKLSQTFSGSKKPPTGAVNNKSSTSSSSSSTSKAEKKE